MNQRSNKPNRNLPAARLFRHGLIILALPLLLAGGCGGCSDTSDTPGSLATPDATEANERLQKERFENAIRLLNRLEEYDADEVLQEIIRWLNQWVKAEEPTDKWKTDGLVAGLIDEFPNLNALRRLDRLDFSNEDGLALQEAAWIRDVAKWSHGKQFDDLSRAKKLFDWTVRNIQLDLTPHVAQFPWQTILSGQGSDVERAWVFVLLARQLHIDAAILGIKRLTDPDENPPIPWAVAIRSSEKIYLFDPQAGLPIAAPQGIRLDGQGQLDITPATLTQAVSDPKVLGQMNLDSQRPYRVQQSALKRIVAMPEASSAYLSRRMEMIELSEYLDSSQKIVLSTDATGQVARWKKAPHVTDAFLWRFPYSTILDQAITADSTPRQRPVVQMLRRMMEYPALWRGRLRHLRRLFDGSTGARSHYQSVRPTRQELKDFSDPEGEAMQQYIKAAKQSNPNLTDRQTLEAAWERLKPRANRIARNKADASYWLGLIAFEQQNYESAINWLKKRTLEETPNGPWTDGATYNLGRSYEAIGQYDEAIEQYESHDELPTYYGNLLRAKWLKSQRPAADDKDAEIPDEKK